jgi:hypothetical protein
VGVSESVLSESFGSTKKVDFSPQAKMTRDSRN